MMDHSSVGRMLHSPVACKVKAFRAPMLALRERSIARRFAEEGVTLKLAFTPNRALEQEDREVLFISVGRNDQRGRDPLENVVLTWYSAERIRADDGRGALLARALSAVSQIAWELAPAADLYGRVKSDPSTRSKARMRPLAEVLDVLGARVIMPEIADCYRLIDQLHARFEFFASEYNDYIDSPKCNGYRSLHTTIVTALGCAVEVQIRTPGMHALAEQRAAASWLYRQRRTLTELPPESALAGWQPLVPTTPDLAELLGLQ